MHFTILLTFITSPSTHDHVVVDIDVLLEGGVDHKLKRIGYEVGTKRESAQRLPHRVGQQEV